MNVNERHLVFQWHPQMLWCHGLFFQVRSSTKWRRVDAYVYGTFGRADRAEFGQSDREPGVQYYVACLKSLKDPVIKAPGAMKTYKNIKIMINYVHKNIWYIYIYINNMYKYTDFFVHDIVLFVLYTYIYICIYIDRIQWFMVTPCAV